MDTMLQALAAPFVISLTKRQRNWPRARRWPLASAEEDGLARRPEAKALVTLTNESDGRC